MVNAYNGRKLMIDTNCFIYLIEGNRYPDFLVRVEPLFNELRDGSIQGITSPITLTEIMTMPRKMGREDLAYIYKSLICNFPNLTILSIDSNVADQAAALRASYNIKTPDALQIATGIAYGASFFATFDQELKKVSPLIKVIIPGEE